MPSPAVLLKKAQQYLRSSAILLETGDFDSSASRAYFAMFFAAQALLLERHEGLPKQAGIRSAFIEQFVDNGPFPERARHALERGHSLQELADYSHDFAVPEDDAEALLAEAEAFVNSIAQFRSAQPGAHSPGPSETAPDQDT